MRKIPIAMRERLFHALCHPSFRITRSAIFLLLVLVLKMPATAFAQDSTFTISLQHARLETVFQILQEKGNYNVLYNNERISKAPLVNLSLRNASVEQVLDSCFAHMPFSYSIRDRTIVISSGKKTAADTPPSKVNGTVTDNKGTPLAGVTVTLKNSTIATVTNEQGEYKLAVPGETGTLIFSSVGYTTREAAINHRPEINIALENSVASLDQLVVVGYGTQKQKDLTGSVARIGAAQMEQYPSGSINTSMQGKIAGLQITTNSGEPGAGANITLRGVSSINGSSQPLIIIDGVPVNNDEYSSLGDGSNFSPLNDIDASDIESIEVLKDAASASIYGSRASNGVILITTKTGSGLKPQINFSLNTSMVDITRKIGVLNASEWRSAYIDATYNATGALTTKKSVIDSLHPYYRNSYDWQDILFRQAQQYKADVSVSGASKDKQINYYVSAGYKDLQPVAVQTNYSQVYGTFRLNYKINKFISGGSNFNLSNYKYSRILGGGDGSAIYWALHTMPVYSPYDPITGALIPLFEGSKPSPLAQAIYSTNEIKRWRLLGKQELTFHLAKGLEFKTSLGVDYSNTEMYYYEPPILSTVGSSRNVYSYYNPTSYTSLVNENTLTYHTGFNGGHHLDLLAGQSYQQFKSNYVYLRGQGSIDNQITSISGAAAINSFSQRLSEHRLSSFFARANYNYEEKYLLSLVLRQDGSSRFGADNRFAYFPSISAGWRFSDEPFLKSSRILSDGKLRLGYGVTGNENIGDYAAQGSVAKAGSYLNQVAIVATGLPNEGLKWETTRQTDLGMDLSLLKGRISLTIDAYLKNTDNLLFNVQIPNQTGYSSIPYNFGSLQNKGLDFQLNGTILKGPLTWDATFTFGLNRNKITSLPGGQDYRPNNISLARVGRPVGVFYGFRSLGVYARDEDNVYKKDGSGNVVRYRKGSSTGPVYKGGDEIWEDVNGDGVINDEDLQIIGNPSPAFFGGLQTNFTYKDFRLGLFFNYVNGNDVYNNVVNSIDNYQFDTNYTIEQLRRWKNQGDRTDVPRIVKGDPMQNNTVSSRYVEDGSFIRLQTISLGYILPHPLLSRLHISSAVLGLSFANLLTWGSYTGYDPEVSSSSNPLGFGVDNGAFPRSKSCNLSLDIKF